MNLKNIQAWPSVRVTRLDRFLDATVLRCIPNTVRPNHVTVARFLLTPVVLILLFMEHYHVGIFIFLFAAATDLIDGAMARTRKQITDWGTLYDPVADKLLIGTTSALLMFTYVHWAIPVALVCIELALVAGVLGIAQCMVVRIRPNHWGKWKMYFQSVGIGMLIVHPLCPTYILSKYATYVLMVAVCLGVISGICYAQRFRSPRRNI